MAGSVIRNRFLLNCLQKHNKILLIAPQWQRTRYRQIEGTSLPQQISLLSFSLHRQFSVTPACCQEAEEDLAEDSPDDKPLQTRQTVDLETSVKYMNSEAFQITYGDQLVWEPYRRNHKGALPPRKTRKQCIRKGVISTGNPCPICRDEYLLVHYKNIDLLKQFVSPYTGEVLSYEKTGVCQDQHRKLLVAVQQAWDYGLLEMPLPEKYYNYSDYRPKKL